MESIEVAKQAIEFLPLLMNIGVGIIGLFVSLSINVFFLRYISIGYEIKARIWFKRGNPNGVFFHYFLAIIYLMLVQMLAIIVWGAMLLIFSLVKDPVSAIIFAGSCYTTIGLEPDTLPLGWHFMSIIIALSGLFAVALATASMINMTTLFRRAWLMKHADQIEAIMHREDIVIPDFVSLEETIHVKAEIKTKDTP